MPTQELEQSETPTRSGLRKSSSPTTALRTSEIRSMPLAATATQQSHKRSPPCKRCAASARRRSCGRSLWFVFAEFLEARIIPERIEHRIEPEQRRSERLV